MQSGLETASPAGPRDDIFATTRWTVVLAAKDRDLPQAAQALEQLCRTYWLPIYGYVRRRGHGKEDAEDLTQAFFARLLQKEYLSGIDAGRGKFRAFLLATLKNFLANEWDKTQRQKRGGNVPHLSLDCYAAAESQLEHLGKNAAGDPDDAFDREWALALLDAVVHKLAEEWQAEGRAEMFEQLKHFLTGKPGAQSSAETARKLGLTEGALRVAVHRLRKRYRQLLRLEIAQTLSDPVSVDEEVRVLFEAVRGEVQMAPGGARAVVPEAVWPDDVPSSRTVRGTTARPWRVLLHRVAS